VCPVQTASVDFSQNDWKAVTATSGEFKVEQFAQPVHVLVLNDEKTMGVVTKITGEQRSETFRLSALGNASGRLLDEDGDQPAAGIRLTYGIMIANEAN